MNVEKMWNEISNAKTIGIAGHVRPDGDCIGSCMALYQYLVKEYPKKKIDVYFESIPDRFLLLSKIEDAKSACNVDNIYDIFISLDCSDKERLGDAEKYFEQAKHTICIDHHISNMGYAKQNIIVADASSTSEVLFTVLDQSKIDYDIATSLYLGIIHDSGVFKYSCTSRKTMEVAGILLEKGVKNTKLIDETFYQKTYIQNQILGRVLLESILVLDGKVITSCVTQKMMKFYGATTQDLEGIVEQLRITKGVEMAIFLHELEPLRYKVSMRSNELVDVNKIARQFGGGGHVKAAGCTMTGNYYDIINNLLKFVDQQLQEK